MAEPPRRSTHRNGGDLIQTQDIQTLERIANREKGEAKGGAQAHNTQPQPTNTKASKPKPPASKKRKSGDDDEVQEKPAVKLTTSKKRFPAAETQSRDRSRAEGRTIQEDIQSIMAITKAERKQVLFENLPEDSLARRNIKYRGFPDNELQHNRTPKAIHFTWLTQHPEKEGEKGYVLFYSSLRRYGGPYSALSNFSVSPFTDEKPAPNRIFRSFEHYYQYMKARCFKFAPEVFDSRVDPPLSSWEVAEAVLMIDSPSDAAEFTRGFVKHVMNQSQNGDKFKSWYTRWKVVWGAAILIVLKGGLLLKFQANPKHKEVLMKTGDYELVEAAPRDLDCGIGFPARTALQHMDKWAANYLGRALMEVRDTLRAKEPDQYLEKFDAEFFIPLEDDCYEDYDQSKADKAANEGPAMRTTRVTPSLHWHDQAVEKWQESVATSEEKEAAMPATPTREVLSLPAGNQAVSTSDEELTASNQEVTPAQTGVQLAVTETGDLEGLGNSMKVAQATVGGAERCNAPKGGSAHHGR